MEADSFYEEDTLSIPKMLRDSPLVNFVVVEVILPHFRVRPFRILLSSLLRNSKVLGLNLEIDSALQLTIRMLRKNPC